MIALLQLISKTPYVNYLIRGQLHNALAKSGFEITCERERAKGEAAFTIAPKPEAEAALAYPDN